MKMETPVETPIETPVETPVERVTNSKNPKKVAAGKKSAAARKALLEQLQNSKEKIQPLPPAPSKAAAPRGPEKSTGMPYVALAVVAAVAVGAVLLSTQKSADIVKARAPEAGAVLNRQPDPFYMR